MFLNKAICSNMAAQRQDLSIFLPNMVEDVLGRLTVAGSAVAVVAAGAVGVVVAVVVASAAVVGAPSGAGAVVSVAVEGALAGQRAQYSIALRKICQCNRKMSKNLHD